MSLGGFIRILRIFFWFVLCVFLYQNCEQNLNVDGVEVPPGTDVSSASLGEVDVAKSVWIFYQQQEVEMDLSSGEALFPDGRRCLVDEKRRALVHLLSNNSVCQIDFEYPEDVLCTLQYIHPYLQVWVQDRDEMLPFGEQTSGCPDRIYSLCTQESQLRQMLTDLEAADFGTCD